MTCNLRKKERSKKLRRVYDEPKPLKEEGRMKCAHLITSCGMSACSALDNPYVPSLFELTEYCKRNEHRKCPFYLKGIICVNHIEGDARRINV